MFSAAYHSLQENVVYRRGKRFDSHLWCRLIILQNIMCMCGIMILPRCRGNNWDKGPRGVERNALEGYVTLSAARLRLLAHAVCSRIDFGNDLYDMCRMSPHTRYLSIEEAVGLMTPYSCHVVVQQPLLVD